MIISLVFNKLFYCSCVWSNTPAANFKKLQLVQNFTSKIVTGTRKFDHATPLLRQLEWLRVEQILYPGDAVMAYKCINGLAPSYLLNNIVTGTRKFHPVTPLLCQLKWLRVEQILYPGDAVMVYKCINGLAPSHLLNKIARRTQIHNRHTRNRNSLQIPLFKTATGQRTFTYRIASIWNNLSENLKQSASLNIFKQRLREHLLTIN